MTAGTSGPTGARTSAQNGSVDRAGERLAAAVAAVLDRG